MGILSGGFTYGGTGQMSLAVIAAVLAAAFTAVLGPSFVAFFRGEIW